MRNRRRPRNIIEQLRRHGDEGDWTPQKKPAATDSPPGSYDKVEVMRRRMERGQSLFNSKDGNYDGYIGTRKP